jgi:glutamate/tyrosine decarboxylase-like PLP-dependent enzyme
MRDAAFAAGPTWRISMPPHQRKDHAGELAASGGLDAAIHMDGASGGFVAGFEGYRRVHQACQELRDSDSAGYTVFDVSERLRMAGWLVPAYTFPENMTQTAVIRIVVRNGLSRDLADVLLADLRREVKVLSSQPHAHLPLAAPGKRQSFAH